MKATEIRPEDLYFGRPAGTEATLVRIAVALERIGDRLEAADRRYDAEQAGYEAATVAFDQKLAEVTGVPA